jgi:hypothetical protein
LPCTFIATSLCESMGVHAICCSEYELQPYFLPCYTVTMDALDQNSYEEGYLPPRPLLQPILNEAALQCGDIANIIFQHHSSPRRFTQVNVNIPCTMQAVRLIQIMRPNNSCSYQGAGGFSLWYIRDSATKRSLHGEKSPAYSTAIIRQKRHVSTG